MQRVTQLVTHDPTPAVTVVLTYEASYKKRCYMLCLRFTVGWTYTRISKDQDRGIGVVWNICQGRETPKKENVI